MLNIFIYVVYIYHINTNITIFFKKTPKNIFLVVLISILIVRYNIINSVHNFINSSTHNQYDYYIVVILFCAIISLQREIFKNTQNTVNIINHTLLLLLFVTLNLMIYNICFCFFFKPKQLLFYVVVFTTILLLNKYKYITQNNMFIYSIISFNFFYFIFFFYNKLLNFFCIKLKFYKLEHIFICLFIILVLHQFFIFNVDNVLTYNTQYKNFKVGGKTNIFIYKYNCFLKQTIFLEDFLKQIQLYDNVFEKTITSTNTKEYYNYNNQILFFIGFIPIFLISILFVFVVNMRFFKRFNKKHCLQINI
jgi:hypothetical protein